jgi:hypothetical protein
MYYDECVQETSFVELGKTKLKQRGDIRNHLRFIGNAFPTIDNLSKFKDFNGNKICFMCKKKNESLIHIFFECEGSENIRIFYNINNFNITNILKETMFIRKVWKFRNDYLHKSNN